MYFFLFLNIFTPAFCIFFIIFAASQLGAKLILLFSTTLSLLTSGFLFFHDSYIIESGLNFKKHLSGIIFADRLSILFAFMSAVLFFILSLSYFGVRRDINKTKAYCILFLLQQFLTNFLVNSKCYNYSYYAVTMLTLSNFFLIGIFEKKRNKYYSINYLFTSIFMLSSFVLVKLMLLSANQYFIYKNENITKAILAIQPYLSLLLCVLIICIFPFYFFSKLGGEGKSSSELRIIPLIPSLIGFSSITRFITKNISIKDVFINDSFLMIFLIFLSLACGYSIFYLRKIKNISSIASCFMISQIPVAIIGLISYSKTSFFGGILYFFSLLLSYCGIMIVIDIIDRAFKDVETKDYYILISKVNFYYVLIIFFFLSMVGLPLTISFSSLIMITVSIFKKNILLGYLFCFLIFLLLLRVLKFYMDFTNGMNIKLIGNGHMRHSIGAHVSTTLDRLALFIILSILIFFGVFPWFFLSGFPSFSYLI